MFCSLALRGISSEHRKNRSWYSCHGLPLSCDLCTYTTEHPGHLRQHQRTHLQRETRPKPLSCDSTSAPICPRASDSRHSLVIIPCSQCTDCMGWQYRYQCPNSPLTLPRILFVTFSSPRQPTHAVFSLIIFSSLPTLVLWPLSTNDIYSSLKHWLYCRNVIWIMWLAEGLLLCPRTAVSHDRNTSFDSFGVRKICLVASKNRTSHGYSGIHWRLTIPKMVNLSVNLRVNLRVNQKSQPRSWVCR